MIHCSDWVYVVVKTDPANGHPVVYGVFRSQDDAHKEKDRYHDPAIWVITCEVAAK